MTAAVSIKIFNMSSIVFNQSTALLVSQQTKNNLWPCFLSRKPSSSLSNEMALLVLALLISGDAALESSMSALSSGTFLLGVACIMIYSGGK
eukprot:CAMPEP_0201896572 /NCGR_PEP_ID=MMETSP0902-20130614/44912_1 /ASSEMBLY_ACC=CAM_ASM_000551 /TAXON_ID=420261 /ORGANISM="Thalassiosira antarctica, Strain CCMP982" /LENGTH=91 /DNA_ID=CAMNT_0048429209 /DNA_START=119 /DNA_END=394 /DNA_ORIENTATION=+